MSVAVLLGNSFLSREWLGWQGFGGSKPTKSGGEQPAAVGPKSSQKGGDTTAAVPMAGDQIEGSSIGNHNVSLLNFASLVTFVWESSENKSGIIGSVRETFLWQRRMMKNILGCRGFQLQSILCTKSSD